MFSRLSPKLLPKITKNTHSFKKQTHLTNFPLTTTRHISLNSLISYNDLWTPGAGFTRQLLSSVEMIIEGFHVYSGLPYGVTIVILSVLLRIGLLPLTIKSARATARFQNLLIELRRTMPAGSTTLNPESTFKLQEIIKRHDITPLGPILSRMKMAPFQLAYFFSLRDMCEHPLFKLQFEHDGLLWIKDLSISDPTYLLPLLCAAAMNLSLIFQRGEFKGSDAIGKNLKVLTFLFPVIIGIATSFLPSAIGIYFLTTFITGSIISRIMSIESVKERLNIPPILRDEIIELDNKDTSNNNSYRYPEPPEDIVEIKSNDEFKDESTSKSEKQIEEIIEIQNDVENKPIQNSSEESQKEKKNPEDTEKKQ